MVEGIDDEKKFDDIIKYTIEERFPISLGMEEENSFPRRLR